MGYRVSVSAVKSALHRGRDKLRPESTASQPLASTTLVQQFLDALAANDLDRLQSICSADIQVELVGGAQSETFEQAKPFFAHAHWVFPPAMVAAARAMGFGTKPQWRLYDYQGETLLAYGLGRKQPIHLSHFGQIQRRSRQSRCQPTTCIITHIAGERSL